MQFQTKKNVYEKIVVDLKGMIEAGILSHGEKLPSVRAYAVERKVNPNTVAKAYAQLEKDGYIAVQPKKGAYVCFGEPPNSKKETLDELRVLCKKIVDSGAEMETAVETLVEVYAEKEKGEKA